MTGRHLLIALGSVCVVGAAAVAIAYFTAGGGDSCAVATGTLQPVTAAAFVGGDAPGSVLLPGAGAAEVILRVSNANDYTVKLDSVTLNGTITADADHGGCATPGVTFTAQTGLSVNVASGSSLVALPGAASMSASSPSACQGATFSSPVAITVKTP